MRLPNGETRFVQFGIKSRLIRISERSTAGDPLDEFPKGNSLQRLEGAFVFRVGCTPLDTICHGCRLFLKPPAQIAMASARSLEQP